MFRRQLGIPLSNAPAPFLDLQPAMLDAHRTEHQPGRNPVVETILLCLVSLLLGYALAVGAAIGAANSASDAQKRPSDASRNQTLNRSCESARPVCAPLPRLPGDVSRQP
jgi:hypothetical protein